MALRASKTTITKDTAVKNIYGEVINRDVTDNTKLHGTKWSHVSTGRTGYASALDHKIIEDELNTKKRNMGQGFIKLKVEGGNEKAPLNIGGRMMFPDEKGYFTIIDEDVVNKMASIEEEKRQYVESLIEKCSLSDDICALVLGLDNPGQLDTILGAGYDDGIKMDADVRGTNAKPSALETYDPSGQTYSRAIQKFKMVVKDRMPIMQNMTPGTTINQPT